MANEIKWGAYPGTTTYFTTELNALADGANKLGAEIDNSAAHNMYMDVELNLAVQGGARSIGAYVALYILSSVDGSNYTYGADAVDPPANALVGSFPLDNVVTARLSNLTHILLPAGKLKMLLINQTGQTFAGTLNTLKYTVYNEEIQ